MERVFICAAWCTIVDLSWRFRRIFLPLQLTVDCLQLQQNKLMGWDTGDLFLRPQARACLTVRIIWAKNSGMIDSPHSPFCLMHHEWKSSLGSNWETIHATSRLTLSCLLWWGRSITAIINLQHQTLQTWKSCVITRQICCYETIYIFFYHYQESERIFLHFLLCSLHEQKILV